MSQKTLEKEMRSRSGVRNREERKKRKEKKRKEKKRKEKKRKEKKRKEKRKERIWGYGPSSLTFSSH